MGPGPEVVTPQTAHVKTDMDCGSKSKSKSHDNTFDALHSTTSDSTPPNPTSTTTSPLPAIARRHFRSPMRRANKDSLSIFERDDAPTTAASGNPITVGDVLGYYLKATNQKAPARKRAPSPRTSRDFN